jgi:hypothetical protein
MTGRLVDEVDAWRMVAKKQKYVKVKGCGYELFRWDAMYMYPTHLQLHQ